MNKNIIIADLIFKKLRQELSFDEERVLDVWLEKPENKEYLRQLQETETLYADISEMWKTDMQETEEAFALIATVAQRKHRLSILRHVAGVAASIAIIVGVSLALLSKSKSEPLVATKQSMISFDGESAVLETARGNIYLVSDSVKQVSGNYQNSFPTSEKLNTLRTFRQKLTSVILNDGTRVWLNAESRFEYPDQFNEKERVVTLFGEALFEVAHNIDKPFIVRTKNAVIRVLGTTFNINTLGDTSVTTLVEGSVQIRNNRDDVVTLSPGQQVALNNKNDFSVRNVDVSYYTAWTKNLFAFENQQLVHIISAIAQWYGMSYEFDGDVLQGIRYTSIIHKYEDVAQTLSVLNEMNEFSAYAANNVIKISTK